MKYLSVLLYTLALLLAACKPCEDPSNPECPNYCNDPGDPECFNYDPCYGKAPVSASFTVEEQIGGRQSTRKETDTVIYSMLLTGPEGVTRYEWHIGTDLRVFTTREVFLSFARDDTNSTIPIVLVVEGTPNASCFPGDNGRDTCRKSIFVTPARMARIVGKYRGVRKLFPTDTIDIEISRRIDFRGVTFFDLWRLPPTCQDTAHVDAMSIYVSYYAIVVEAGFEYQCHQIEGAGLLKDTDRDSIIFPFTNTQSPPDVFRGKRMKP